MGLSNPAATGAEARAACVVIAAALAESEHGTVGPWRLAV